MKGKGNKEGQGNSMQRAYTRQKEEGGRKVWATRLGQRRWKEGHKACKYVMGHMLEKACVGRGGVKAKAMYRRVLSPHPEPVPRNIPRG